MLTCPIVSDDLGKPIALAETAAAAHAAVETVRRFQLVSADGQTRWPATGGRLSVGSLPGNDVVLGDVTVSLYHCQITASAKGVWVVDLDSTNGTAVDGVFVKEGRLAQGSVLRLGNSELRYEALPERETVEVSAQGSFGPLVGASAAMRTVFAVLERAARTDTTILLEGETGTGKGAVADALHSASARKDGPFVVVDCGALPPTLLESELFGHERGAFTGADQRRIGAFEEASGGTIFLDEIGELPAEMQPRLLRVLENRAVRRVGQNSYQPVDVRVIAATNRDLRTQVNAGTFRADLYYRLAVLRVTIPPLRARLDDLGELARQLLRGLGATPAQLARLTGPAAIERLQRGSWPGNVRELRNILERSLVLDSPHAAEAEHADPDHALPSFAAARKRALDAFERAYIEELLRQHDGRVTAAARAAGVTRVYIYRLMSRHGIKAP
jgi:DNA-binding NtrC family response regulator